MCHHVLGCLDGQANGIASISNANTLGYAGTFGGMGVSASYNKDSGGGNQGSSKSIVLTSGSLMDGVDVGIGIGDKAGSSSDTGTDLRVMYAKYTMGSVTAGIQHTDIDLSAADSDSERMHIAVSMAINENLSASIGQSTVEFESSSKDDQENTGLAVSYTMGSMTIAAFTNSESSSGGTNGTDDSVSEVSVAFAF
jgi:hypothetical protein